MILSSNIIHLYSREIIKVNEIKIHDTQMLGYGYDYDRRIIFFIVKNMDKAHNLTPEKTVEIHFFKLIME